MFGSVGIPELMIIVVAMSFSLFPIIAGVWAIVMLLGLKAGQQDIKAKLAAIERRLDADALRGRFESERPT